MVEPRVETLGYFLAPLAGLTDGTNPRFAVKLDRDAEQITSGGQEDRRKKITKEAQRRKTPIPKI